MGFLDLDQVFTRIGHTDRRRVRGPRGAAVDSLVASTRRELAMLGANLMGAQAHLDQFVAGDSRGDRRLLRDTIENAAQSYMVIDPRPGLHIIDINDNYAEHTLTQRRKVAGEKLFDIFPDNPFDPDADGVGNLFESLQRTAQSGRPHEMAVQRYDVQDDWGGFVEKHWRCTNIPVFDEHGRLVFLLHHAEDVTPGR